MWLTALLFTMLQMIWGCDKIHILAMCEYEAHQKNCRPSQQLLPIDSMGLKVLLSESATSAPHVFHQVSTSVYVSYCSCINIGYIILLEFWIDNYSPLYIYISWDLNIWYLHRYQGTLDSLPTHHGLIKQTFIEIRMHRFALTSGSRCL